MARSGVQHVTKQAVSINCRRSKYARKRIERSEFCITFQLLSKGHARAPVAGGAAVISKSLGEIILEVIRDGESVTAEAVNGYMAVVVVEGSELKSSVCPDLAVCSNFFVPAVLQNGTAVAH